MIKMENGKRICEYCGCEQDIKIEKCENCGYEFQLGTEPFLDVDLKDYWNELNKKDTSKLPNLRKQEWDSNNPYLDKRFIPKNSCWNCIYGQISEINEFTTQGNIDIYCKKHKYIVKDSNKFGEIRYLYAICDDYLNKKDKKNKVIESVKENGKKISKDNLEKVAKEIPNLGWKTFGMWYVYMMFIPMIGVIPMMIIFPNAGRNGWQLGIILIIISFFGYILPVLLAKRWRKKRILKFIRRGF